MQRAEVKQIFFRSKNRNSYVACFVWFWQDTLCTLQGTITGENLPPCLSLFQSICYNLLCHRCNKKKNYHVRSPNENCTRSLKVFPVPLGPPHSMEAGGDSADPVAQIDIQFVMAAPAAARSNYSM